MKRSYKWLSAGLAVVLVVVLGAAGLAAAGDTGDPLVTLSYITHVFTPKVKQTVDKAIKNNRDEIMSEIQAAMDQWEEQLKTPESGETSEGASVFHVVTLSKGQTLVGEIGCEIMLRVGSAVCVSYEWTGLIDTTGATVINNGDSLVKNHLYMVTIETRGVKATADVTKVLVRGPYTIQDAE